MKFTEEDLERIKELTRAHTSPEALDSLSRDVDEAFDAEIKEWVKKYSVSSLLGSAISGISATDVVYSTFMLAMYIGARMQRNKAEFLTVRVQVTGQQ